MMKIICSLVLLASSTGNPHDNEMPPREVPAQKISLDLSAPGVRERVTRTLKNDARVLWAQGKPEMSSDLLRQAIVIDPNDMETRVLYVLVEAHCRLFGRVGPGRP